MRKRIYLAGPGVFLPDPLAEAERLKALCRLHGFEGLHPMDCGVDLSSMPKREAAQAIFRANIGFIATAYAVMADMRPFRGPGMDGGTAFEMGYAAALGKPLVGYGCTENYAERCRRFFGGPGAIDPDGLVVEDFDYPDNLMMACSALKLVESEEAALAYLAELFSIS